MYKFVTDSVTKERKNMNNKDNKVIILDIETTGTDINSDEVLQISIINDKGDTLLKTRETYRVEKCRDDTWN